MIAPSIDEKRSFDLFRIKKSLQSLLHNMTDAAANAAGIIEQLHPSQRVSAENLVHYLSLRSEDIRDLQDQLHIYGLSSLASSESHIRYQLQSILQWLGQTFSEEECRCCDYHDGRKLIETRSVKLFGNGAASAIPAIMVTFDTEFADNYQLIKKLLESGMNVARINTAHDDEKVWSAMISLIKEAEQKTGIPCKIFMDLAGPKLRTSIVGKGHSSGKIALFEGQQIILAEPDADFDPSGIVIGCDEQGIIAHLKPGERVLFDDGLIESTVISNEDGMAALQVKRVSSKKQQLREGKGINFPDSKLKLPALSAYDFTTLPFICAHADMIGYSFIRDAADIATLQQQLDLYKRKPAMVLKIETPDAVKNFASLLIQGMRDEIFGVMIARGDLAVEIGFERMSEIQQEILWISEAAHVPVIWATQVLETLNKSGIATRSEITDAAYAGMSECVMINKGDYIINVIKSLTEILRRSSGYHVKKRYTFGPMDIAAGFFQQLPKAAPTEQ